MDFVQVTRERAGNFHSSSLAAMFYGDGCLARAQKFVEDVQEWPEGCYWKQASVISVPIENGNHATWMYMRVGGNRTGYLASWGRSTHITEEEAFDQIRDQEEVSPPPFTDTQYRANIDEADYRAAWKRGERRFRGMTLHTQTSLLDHDPYEVIIMGHEPKDLHVPQCDHEVNRVAVTVRQIGWLDQNGVVYPLNEVPEGSEFRGGSLTPLLINPGCD